MKNKEKNGHFRDLGIADNFLAVLEKLGFTIPTPIQKEIIPSALEGDDVVGIAQTGTGKTLAFGIPVIQRIAMHKGQALILVPTRELALQVEGVMKTIGKPLGLYCAVVIGGTSSYHQIKALQRKPHVVIATPGRLIDLMDQGEYSLDLVHCIILDEADRMLDIGFLPHVKRILKETPQEKQIMLFSATMPQSIATLAHDFMYQPVKVEIAPQGTSVAQIEQSMYFVEGNNRMRLLDKLLNDHAEDTVLVFSRTKHGAKKIAQNIRGMGHTATEIHSNRSQAQRQRALDGFIKKQFRVMVATDIAARGIDVEHIALVVNYDLPDCLEDYVHRIGRTGRAGRGGKAVSFALPKQRREVKGIERLIKKKVHIEPLPELPAARPKLVYDDEEKRSYGGGRNNRSQRSGGKRSYGGVKSYGSKSSGSKTYGSKSSDSQSSGSKSSRSRAGSWSGARKRSKEYSGRRQRTVV